jgi:hypothetical protein
MGGISLAKQRQRQRPSLYSRRREGADRLTRPRGGWRKRKGQSGHAQAGRQAGLRPSWAVAKGPPYRVLLVTAGNGHAPSTCYLHPCSRGRFDQTVHCPLPCNHPLFASSSLLHRPTASPETARAKNWLEERVAAHQGPRCVPSVLSDPGPSPGQALPSFSPLVGAWRFAAATVVFASPRSRSCSAPRSPLRHWLQKVRCAVSALRL